MVSCPRLSAVTGSHLSRLRLYEWERALPYSQHGAAHGEAKKLISAVRAPCGVETEGR
jgi:hypothetical protein